MSNLKFILYYCWKVVFQHLTGRFKHSSGHMSGMGDTIEITMCYCIVVIEVLLIALIGALVY